MGAGQLTFHPDGRAAVLRQRWSRPKAAGHEGSLCGDPWLIRVLHRQSDGGHSVVVIEHDRGVIAEADLVVALGPKGGDAGGLI